MFRKRVKSSMNVRVSSWLRRYKRSCDISNLVSGNRDHNSIQYDIFYIFWDKAKTQCHKIHNGRPFLSLSKLWKLELSESEIGTKSKVKSDRENGEKWESYTALILANSSWDLISDFWFLPRDFWFCFVICFDLIFLKALFSGIIEICITQPPSK